MTYLSYAEGFKGGGWNSHFNSVLTPQQQVALQEFKPEKAKTVEIGAKLDLLGDSLRLNLAVFDSRYTDMQVTYRGPAPAGVAPFLTNAGKASIKGHDDLAFEDVFAGDAPALATATSIAGPLSMVLANDREKVAFDTLAFEIDAIETPLTSTIERVWIDDTRPKSGRTVPLKILTRSYRGEEKISTVPLAIPANASGSLSIMVTDGRQLNALEQRELRRSVQVQSVEQMIRILNTTRRNNRIYVRLLAGAQGAVVNGEAMTALPPSVLSVLEADRNGGSFSPIRNATIGEYEIPMAMAVVGARVLTIEVENR